MGKEGLVPTKAISRTAIAQRLEDRRKSFPALVEAHANMSALGMHDEGLTKARRELLIASFSRRP